MKWPNLLLVCAVSGCSYASHGARAHDAAPAHEADAGSTAAMSGGGRAGRGSGFEASGAGAGAGEASTASANGIGDEPPSEMTTGHGGSNAPSSAGAGGSHAMSTVGGDSQAVAAGRTGAAAGEDAGPPPPEVWIGELWTLEPKLCEPDGKFPPGSAPEAHSERVVLLLDRDSDPAAPTGRIRIGDAVPPAAPSPEPNDPLKDLAEKGGFTPNDSSYWCATSNLTDGAEYSVLESYRSAERLRFSVAPVERWRAWCESQGLMAPPCLETRGCELPLALCPCGAGGCQPHVGMRVALDFTIAGDAMETIVQPYETTQIRLQRVQ